MNGKTKGKGMTAKHELMSALARAGAVCNPKSAIPILASARIIGTKTGLTVSATDLSLSVSSRVSITDHKLDVCADAKRLLAAVKAMSGDDVPSLDVEGNRLTVKLGRRKISLDVHPGSEYPEGPEFTKNTVQTTVQRGALLTALRSVVHCAADDATRPHMAGVQLTVYGDTNIEAVATNGHALALHPYTDAPGMSPVLSALVPTRGAREMIRAMEETTAATVILRADPTRIGIVLPDSTLTATMINAAFPDWRQVMPKRGPVRATVDREALRSSLASVCTVADGQTACVVCSIGDGVLTLEATNNDVGAASDSIECKTEGTLRCGLSARYLGAALAASESSDVTLSSDGKDVDPVRIDATNAIHVVMPMRV